MSRFDKRGDKGGCKLGPKGGRGPKNGKLPTKGTKCPHKGV